MIKDTACEKCPYKAKGEECPNYIETIWHEEGNQQPRIVRDCAPRRNLLLTQELYNRIFCLHKQVSQAEGQIEKMRTGFTNMIQAIHYIEEAKAVEMQKSKLLKHLSEMKGTEDFRPKYPEKT